MCEWICFNLFFKGIFPFFELLQMSGSWGGCLWARENKKAIWGFQRHPSPWQHRSCELFGHDLDSKHIAAQDRAVSDMKSLSLVEDLRRTAQRLVTLVLKKQASLAWGLLILTTKALSIKEITCQPQRLNCGFPDWWAISYRKKHQLQPFESDALPRLGKKAQARSNF